MVILLVAMARECSLFGTKLHVYVRKRLSNNPRSSFVVALSFLMVNDMKTRTPNLFKINIWGKMARWPKQTKYLNV